VTERFVSQRLDPDRHDAGAFRSGESALDDWLRDHAATEDRRGHSRTWVLVDKHGRVVAYYTLSAHKLAREAVPTKIARGGPQEIPATLIGKLALSADLRGRGLGALLLADALERVVIASRQVAVKLVVVDALHEQVAAWYERLGFVRMPGSLVLVQRVRDIAAARDDAMSRDQG
jgi:predicted GNAT family N-acyltransferase